MKHGMKLSSAFLLLAMFAIFVRGLIPAGFMPDFSSSKLYAITICSGMSTKTIYVHDDKAPAGAHDEKKDMAETCPFAAPVLADTSASFNIADFISVAYAKFIPTQFADINTSKLVLKSYLAQGPPDAFAV